MKTPHINLLQVHCHDHDTPAEETMKPLHNGKVYYVGVSSMRAWQLAHYLNGIAARNGLMNFGMQRKISLSHREEVQIRSCLELAILGCRSRTPPSTLAQTYNRADRPRPTRRLYSVSKSWRRNVGYRWPRSFSGGALQHQLLEGNIPAGLAMDDG
ncbi:hypothetical protein PM082_011067 [Marasmius tenuissimus]|nr:hypothetical protein PM082_011067 [Marasmius tenuissimus]